MWRLDQIKHGCGQLAELTPEVSELTESGYISSAKSELMRNPETKYAEWENYSEIDGFKFDLKEAMQTTTFISGSRGTGKSDIAMYAVDRIKNEGIVCVVFDSSLDWLKRSSINRYLTVQPYSVLEVPNESTIFDISLLSPLEQQRTIEDFCGKLFRSQVNSDRRFYLVCEESQLYFPLNSIRAKRYQNSARILTVGRNVNVSMCAVSQFPALADKELVKNAQQIYIGCTSEFNTLRYWQGILGKKAEELKNLENGEFLYYCRNAISKIQIEPYENTTPKTEIPTTEPKPIEPIPIRTTHDYAVTKSAIMSLLLIMAIVYGLTQML
jgi:hypothetical protein